MSATTTQRTEHRRARIVRPASPLAHSIADAAVAIGIGATKICQLVASGELPSITIGRRRLIAAEDLAAFIRERQRIASRRV